MSKRILALGAWGMLLCLGYASCTFYRFSSVNIPPEVRTVYIEQFGYQYEAVDVQLPPLLRNAFMDLTSNRTKLTVVDNVENADWIISGSILEYKTQLIGLSGATLNTANPSIQGTALKVNISIRLTLLDRKTGEKKDYTASDETSADGNKTFVQIQNEERRNIVDRLSQSIFNQVYSNW